MEKLTKGHLVFPFRKFVCAFTCLNFRNKEKLFYQNKNI